MIGLVLLVVIAIWAWIGFSVWRSRIRPRLQSGLQAVVVSVLFALAWFVVPVLDEILGAPEFERLCKEMPEIKFHGPVPMGPGSFFDEAGKPKWKTREELSLIRYRNSRWGNTEWEDAIGQRDAWRIITHWPMLIGESTSVYYDKRNGRVFLETFSRFSPGGRIKQYSGLTAIFGAYQCPSKGKFPSSEEFITFYSGNNAGEKK